MGGKEVQVVQGSVLTWPSRDRPRKLQKVPEEEDAQEMTCSQVWSCDCLAITTSLETAFSALFSSC